MEWPPSHVVFTVSFHSFNALEVVHIAGHTADARRQRAAVACRSARGKARQLRQKEDTLRSSQITQPNRVTIADMLLRHPPSDTVHFRGPLRPPWLPRWLSRFPGAWLSADGGSSD